ncbi:MAG: Gfo/Idh/MocA family oxidoreductase, partial [Candidatus Poribacteria bacterium]
GPGGAGRGNTMGFATRPDCEVVAAADVSPASMDALEAAMEERVDGYSRGTLARYTGEYEYTEMLAKEDLDIVGVFSPHSMHDIQVKAAMRAGCSVIVEKPMANCVGDAVLMHKMALGLGVHLVGGYQRHYEPSYITGREVIQSGQLGEMERFEVYMAQRWGAGGWRGDPRFSGGGQPNDSGSHLQDIFMWMTGFLPESVHGTTDMIFEENGEVIPKQVEINSYSDVVMEGGAEGTITIIGNTTVGFEEWVTLVGSEGTLDIKDGMWLTLGDAEPVAVEASRPDGYPDGKVDQLVGLVKGDYDRNYTSGINGIRTSWLTNSILAAGRGPDAKNHIDCDALVEGEGSSRAEVKQLIADAAHWQGME